MRASVLLAMVLGCGSTAPPPAVEPSAPVAEATPEPAEDEAPYTAPAAPDGCFATACDRLYNQCIDSDGDVDVEADCDPPYVACLAEACARVEPIEIEPVELADLLRAIPRPIPARAACPPESDDVYCEVSTCAATSDGGHEACVVEIQSPDEEGTVHSLAVRDGRRWARAIPVVGRAVSPASMTSSWVDSPALRWVEGENGPWLTLRWSAGFTDADWCSGAGGADTMIALCGPRDGRTVCAAALRLAAAQDASTGRIDLTEEADEAERDVCTDDYLRRALELERWTHAQPIFDVLVAPTGTLVWVDRPALLDGVETLDDLAARAEGTPALGEW